MRRQSSVFTLSKSYSRRKSETPPPAPVDLTRLTLDETSEEGSVSKITHWRIPYCIAQKTSNTGTSLSHQKTPFRVCLFEQHFIAFCNEFTQMLDLIYHICQ